MVEREWEEKLSKLQAQLDEARRKIEAMHESHQNDKILISKTYEGQLKMLTEQILDLQTI